MSVATVDQIELFWEEHGSGDPLLLIMGLATDSIAWMYQVPAFAERYRTIVFDNRGVGRSSKPAGPYTIAQMAGDTVGLLDALDVPRAHVLGISMGGMIAQELALRHPDRVRSLVLACTYPEPDPGVLATHAASMAALGGGDGAALDPATIDPFAIFQTLMPLVFNPRFLEQELPKLMQLFSGSLQHGFDIGAIMAQVQATLEHRTTDRLQTITAPTLVVTGDADRLIPPGSSDVLAEHIPNAKLVKIPGGSHGFNFETPDVFNRTVLDFLASVGS